MIKSLMIHVPKTGGSSVFSCLKQIPGMTYQDLSVSIRPVLDPECQLTYACHLSVDSLIERKVFTREFYNSRFKFAFVRNPWDRLVSLFEYLQYRHRQKRERASNRYLHSFHDFVMKVTEPDCPYLKPLGKVPTDDWSQANPQVCWVDQGVDFIGRYESLEEDVDTLCSIMECPLPPKLPTIRKSNRRLGHYSNYYTPQLEAKVFGFYLKDIERFDYCFERRN